MWFISTASPDPGISSSSAAAGERSIARLGDGGIRLVMVTSISLPVAIFFTFALPPTGIAGWAAVKPGSVISCVASPWCSPINLCAIQKPVVNNKPSIASITRLIPYLLTSGANSPGAIIPYL